MWTVLYGNVSSRENFSLILKSKSPVIDNKQGSIFKHLGLILIEEDA